MAGTERIEKMVGHQSFANPFGGLLHLTAWGAADVRRLLLSRFEIIVHRTEHDASLADARGCDASLDLLVRKACSTKSPCPAEISFKNARQPRLWFRWVCSPQNRRVTS